MGEALHISLAMSGLAAQTRFAVEPIENNSSCYEYHCFFGRVQYTTAIVQKIHKINRPHSAYWLNGHPLSLHMPIMLAHAITAPAPSAHQGEAVS